MHKLTIIIPFLNEGIEVYNTLKSFKDSTKSSFNIILINDCSTDHFDYRKVAEEFNAIYVEHEERKGVAASRDEGVRLCITEYFILLDAHMRVYQEDWLTIITELLDVNKKLLICCSTFALDVEGNPYSSSKSAIGYGAVFDFSNLNINWLYSHNQNISNIPCVLGASYACNKQYWSFLKGLEGLKSYGFDEQLISLKVWLSGGSCKVVKDIVFGHIFRDNRVPPYQLQENNYYLNQLLIVELFYNDEFKKIFIQKMRHDKGMEFVNLLINKANEIRNLILEQKEYYQTIFCNSFEDIIALNKTFTCKN